MSLSSFRRYRIAPTLAAKPSPEDWQAIENRIRPLPSDYKDFISEFGSGSFDQFLWIFSPFVKNKHLNLFDQLQPRLQAYAEMKKVEPHESPFDAYPTPGGLFLLVQLT